MRSVRQFEALKRSNIEAQGARMAAAARAAEVGSHSTEELATAKKTTSTISFANPKAQGPTSYLILGENDVLTAMTLAACGSPRIPCIWHFHSW